MKSILALNIGSKGFSTEFVRAADNLGIELAQMRSRNMCFVLEDGIVRLYHQNEVVDPLHYSYLFIRVAGNFAHMTSLLAQYFLANDVPISDHAYLEHTHNEEKITQMLRFTLEQVAIPKSILFTIDGYQENEATIQSAISYPCVLKTNGSQGRNVWKMDTPQMLSEKLRELLALNIEIGLLQEMVPNTYDIRAIYMHGDIIGAVKRIRGNGFLNNVSQGGRTEATELTREEEDLAVRASKVLGRSFSGVDIVRTDDGPLIFEVNLGPQIYGFESATKIDVPRELLIRIKQAFLDKKDKP